MKNVWNEFFDKLFSRGMQVGNIVTKGENGVGRNGTVSTGDSVRCFTYDILTGGSKGDGEHATDKLERATEVGTKKSSPGI